MNGAESLVKTLVENSVEVCFTNPGTSEMHFVSALDKVPGVRCVLGLFEGVVTGAADGYYRMADKPASTLLHLGPGLGNGLANLHNAKKANSRIVNIVGEHALHHIECDAPLTSDIEGVARPMSHWVKTTKSSHDVSRDGALAIEQANHQTGEQGRAQTQRQGTGADLHHGQHHRAQGQRRAHGQIQTFGEDDQRHGQGQKQQHRGL